MVKQWALTEESLQLLLGWLAQDGGRAGERYEIIRQTLVKLFIWHGCADAEGLADETINRVTRRLPELVDNYTGDPALYFYGVAKLVLKEEQRSARARMPRPPVDPPAPTPPDDEQAADLRQRCLDECLQKLSPENRELILQYYQERGQAKIDNRKEIAQKLDIRATNLRVKIHRIRTTLHSCILECMKREAQG
jgi:RNA polymerase sigma factor (sigma-70 family)